MTPFRRAAVALTFALAIPAGLSAQTQTRPAAPAPPPAPAAPQGPERVIVMPREMDEQRAEDTKRSFNEVMRRYPPALARILRLEPGLFSNSAYLAPYPALVEFVRLHPEVARYPAYFLGDYDEGGYREPRTAEAQLKSEAMGVMRNAVEGFYFFAVFGTVAYTLVWLIRYIVGHRRWLRATKVQHEFHSRLMERFSSNAELLAYVQSPAGQRFLEAMPTAVDMGVVGSAATPMGAPFNRILWSVQAGLVLACAGLGLIFAKRYMIEEIAQFYVTIGTLALSVGVGFALAAVASYVISGRLGLLDRPTSADSTRA